MIDAVDAAADPEER
jgi:hypothetical protein